MANATIGDSCSFGQNVLVSSDVRIGKNVKVQNNVSVYTGVELEDDVFCGPSMVFTNVVNPRSHVIRKHEYCRTLVKRDATLGANCTVRVRHNYRRVCLRSCRRCRQPRCASPRSCDGTPRKTSWLDVLLRCSSD